MRGRRSNRGQKRPFLRSPLLYLILTIAVAAVVILPTAERSGIFGDSPRQEPEGQGSSPIEGTAAKVYFLDVGQGDSELIELPADNGIYTILIDTGESEYGDGLCETLEDLGVSRIDALIMSHPHSDHMGCMWQVMENFPIGCLYMPVVAEERTPTTRAYERVLDTALERDIPFSSLERGSRIDPPGEAELEVYSPEEDADWDDLNNYSAVIRLSFGDVSFLFTGDAEEESEEIILSTGADISADVLKCGHHGSSTSTSEEFLATVDPTYAVISCGEGNSYGHPHRETLEILDRYSVETYRTDLDGTVLFETDGEKIEITKNLPSVLAGEN